MASARLLVAEAASREGVLRELMRWRRIATAGWRMLAIGYAALVACFTVLPPRVNRRLFLIDINELVNARLVGRLALVGALVAALMLAASSWRHRRIWTARLSRPLLGWLALCLIGLAALVLISQPPSSLARHGLGQVASIPKISTPVTACSMLGLPSSLRSPGVIG